MSDLPWTHPSDYWPALTRAVADRPRPVVSVDLTALEHNAAELVRRSDGLPVRFASKSVRSRPVIETILAQDGYSGMLAYSLAEAVWAASWCDDVLMAFPSTDADALRALTADEEACRRVTLLVDCTDHLDLIDAVVPAANRPGLRVAIDLDLGHVHEDEQAAEQDRPGGQGGRGDGHHHSHVSTVEQTRALAQEVVDRHGFRLVGALGHERHLSGARHTASERDQGSAGPPASIAARLRSLVQGQLLNDTLPDDVEHRETVSAAIAAIAEVAGGSLETVTGVGTGTVHLARGQDGFTEVAAGSALFGPGMADRWRAFAPAPAAAVALPVVSRDGVEMVTVAGGGWIAWGTSDDDSLPTVTWPRDVELLPGEGAGEVHTLLHGPGLADLQIGDLTWWRHARAGELAEHANELVLLRSTEDENGVTARVDQVVPTYRGEGLAFG